MLYHAWGVLWRAAQRSTPPRALIAIRASGRHAASHAAAKALRQVPACSPKLLSVSVSGTML
eukprot:11729048-Alexandrium_andersonii.AAC.1